MDGWLLISLLKWVAERLACLPHISEVWLGIPMWSLNALGLLMTLRALGLLNTLFYQKYRGATFWE